MEAPLLVQTGKHEVSPTLVEIGSTGTEICPYINSGVVRSLEGFIDTKSNPFAILPHSVEDSIEFGSAFRLRYLGLVGLRHDFAVHIPQFPQALRGLVIFQALPFLVRNCSPNRLAVSPNHGSKSGSIDSTRPANTIVLLENASHGDATGRHLQPSAAGGAARRISNNREHHDTTRVARHESEEII